jgi:hypothetical protein
MSTAGNASRRQTLKSAIALLIGFFVARPARSQPTNGDYKTKLDRELVGYRDAPAADGHHCGDCANYIAPNHCRLVGGEISPGGHCLGYASEDADVR